MSAKRIEALSTLVRWRELDYSIATNRVLEKKAELEEAQKHLAEATDCANEISEYRVSTRSKILDFPYLETISQIESNAWSKVTISEEAVTLCSEVHAASIQDRFHAKRALDMVASRCESARAQWQGHMEKVSYDRMADMRVASGINHD